MNTSIRLSLILPCYNPPGYWKENMLKHFLKLRASENSLELILVNDGSVGLTTESLKEYFGFIPEIRIASYHQNKGKGYALRQGVQLAKGEYIIYTDIDFPYTHDSFLKIYYALESGSDIAMGIRGYEYYTHLSPARIRISRTLRWFIKIFLRIPTDDTQCGLKGFNKKGKEVFLQTGINRYLFDLEFVFLSAKNKLNIKTVEVELRPDVALSKMNWKILLQESTNFLTIFFKSIFNNQ